MQIEQYHILKMYKTKLSEACGTQQTNSIYREQAIRIYQEDFKNPHVLLKRKFLSGTKKTNPQNPTKTQNKTKKKQVQQRVVITSLFLETEKTSL